MLRSVLRSLPRASLLASTGAPRALLPPARPLATRPSRQQRRVVLQRPPTRAEEQKATATEAAAATRRVSPAALEAAALYRVDGTQRMWSKSSAVLAQRLEGYVLSWFAGTLPRQQKRTDVRAELAKGHLPGRARWMRALRRDICLDLSMPEVTTAGRPWAGAKPGAERRPRRTGVEQMQEAPLLDFLSRLADDGLLGAADSPPRVHLARRLEQRAAAASARRAEEARLTVEAKAEAEARAAAAEARAVAAAEAEAAEAAEEEARRLAQWRRPQKDAHAVWSRLWDAHRAHSRRRPGDGDGDGAAPRRAPEARAELPPHADLPPGWAARRHVTRNGREYETYVGPGARVYKSRRAVWDAVGGYRPPPHAPSSTSASSR